MTDSGASTGMRERPSLDALRVFVADDFAFVDLPAVRVGCEDLAVEDFCVEVAVDDFRVACAVLRAGITCLFLAGGWRG